jgi:hypothetical protein
MPNRDQLIANIRDTGYAVVDGIIINDVRDVPATDTLAGAGTEGFERLIEQRPLSLPGLYNPDGLKRYRDGFAEIGLRRDGTGLGGIDIVFLGDSWPSAYAYSFRSDTTAAILRNLLQDRFNPVMRSDGSRYGGPGFIPVYGGASDWTTNDAKDGGQSRTDMCSSVDGTAGTFTDSNLQFLRWTNTGVTNRRLRWTFAGSGTYAIRNRDRITDFEPLVRQFVGDDTLRLDLATSDAFSTISGGTGTIDANAATVQAKHWGRKWTGLTATNTNCPQIGSPASGSFVNDIFGGIGYCDDWDKGIRVHNICNPGTRLALFYTSTTINTYGIAAIDNWGSSAPGSAAAGATRAKLFVLNFILNDILSNDEVLGSGTETVAFWETIMRTTIARIKALASRPSILYIIPPAGTNASRIAFYPQYIAAIKRILADNLDCMTVWDIGENLGDGVNGINAGTAYSGIFTDLGWSNDDGTHLSNLGHAGMGHKLFQILS